MLKFEKYNILWYISVICMNVRLINFFEFILTRPCNLINLKVEVNIFLLIFCLTIWCTTLVKLILIHTLHLWIKISNDYKPGKIDDLHVDSRRIFLSLFKICKPFKVWIWFNLYDKIIFVRFILILNIFNFNLSMYF